ncbi:MAG: hypothetical protein JNM93_06255 [Bacteriovoracaceae bacterium]|nr:hypothetical protein [Bacteriovoracaceae bacterium]
MIFLLVGMVHAERYYTGDVISDSYVEGEYLMYDCREGHWVCATESNSLFCQEQIKQMDDFANFMPCWSFKKHADIYQCMSEQQRLTNEAIRPTFCYKEWPRWYLTKF